MSFSIVSCDGLFDNLEGDLSKISGENLAETEAGLSRMMAAVYSAIPMGAFAGNEKNTDNATDTHSAAYYNSGTSFWNYTTMRDVNNLIKIVDNAYDNGVIDETTHKTYIAEARFVRAYYYFGMVKAYGGVPIVTEPLDNMYDGKENAGLYIPRSTEKETWDFVLNELTEVAAALPESRTDGTYRADKWAALGLKSRVALYAASVSRYWKNAQVPSCSAVNEKLTYMEESYAKGYYDQCIEASEAIIKSGRFSLYNAEPATVEDAVKNLTDLFLARQDSEWIFGRSYDSGVSGATNGFDMANSPAQARTSSTGSWQYARYSINADIVDLYDFYTADFGRADGAIKTRKDGNETAWIEDIATYNDRAEEVEYIAYDNMKDAFANKDARFQAWVLYPGTNFRKTDIIIQGGLWTSKGISIYGNEKDQVTVGGQTYYMYGAETSDGFSGFYKIGNTNDGNWYSTGFGIRKFLNPDEAPLYSTNPWYDIRYAEILLNYCEAIVERDGNNAGDSKTYLNQIRRRANFRDQVDATLENVLKERRLELAFEEDRAMTLHRRREFYRPGIGMDEKTIRKHAIIPVLDGRGTKAQYIMVRAFMFNDDISKKAVIGGVEPKNYYSGIPNYEKNKITPNPSQEL